MFLPLAVEESVSTTRLHGGQMWNIIVWTVCPVKTWKISCHLGDGWWCVELWDWVGGVCLVLIADQVDFCIPSTTHDVITLNPITKYSLIISMIFAFFYCATDTASSLMSVGNFVSFYNQKTERGCISVSLMINAVICIINHFSVCL
jgi:hypothetical protein